MAYNSKYTGTEIDNAVGQTTVLSNQVSSLTTQVNQVSTNLTQLDTKIVDTQQRLDEVVTTVTTNTQVISTMNNTISQMRGELDGIGDIVSDLQEQYLYQYVIEINGFGNISGNHIIFSLFSKRKLQTTGRNMDTLFEMFKTAYGSSPKTISLPCTGVCKSNPSDGILYICCDLLFTLSNTAIDFDIDSYSFNNDTDKYYLYNISNDSNLGKMTITELKII